MGAFLVITIILFPYYLNTSEVDLKKRLLELHGKQQQCQEEGARLTKKLKTAQKKNRDAEAELRKCEMQLARTYLAVVIKWPTVRHDVDLHVVTPQGHEFFYGRRRISGVAAELSADTTRGPGIEIWEMANAPPGEYRVYYKFFSRHGNRNSAPVTGAVYYRNGKKLLPPVILRTVSEKPLIATVIVKPDGDVQLR